MVCLVFFEEGYEEGWIKNGEEETFGKDAG